MLMRLTGSTPPPLLSAGVHANEASRMVLEHITGRQTMADQDREISAELWLISAQKEVLIMDLRRLSHRPNTRGKEATRRQIKRRLDELVEAEKWLIRQL